MFYVVASGWNFSKHESGALKVVLCPSCVVSCVSSTISLNISTQTAEPIWTKLGRNVPWEVLFKNCSQNLIPSKILVALKNSGE